MDKLPLKKSGFTTFMKAERGFTLIELLVVVAVIAILTAIAISVFSNAQGNARDGKRRSDLDSIAKSLEGARDIENKTYTYTSDNFSSDFPEKWPFDPSDDRNYCIMSDNTNSNPPLAPDTWGSTTSGCPDDVWSVFSTKNGLGSDPILSQAKSWRLCVKLERSSTPIVCKANLFR